MVKRIAKVEFIGTFPLIVPKITYEDGSQRMLGLLPVEEGEKALPIQGMLQSSEVSPWPARLQLPKLPQLNDFLGQLSRNIVSVLEGVIPKQQHVYYHQETKREYVKRMQKDNQLFPTCVNSSFIVTKCSTCDRNEICSSLREKERERIKIMKEMYE